LHKLAVLERHGRNGNVGRGIVKGFGRMRGAIAASIGHDCHNLIVAGADDADMALAINRLIELDGGIAVAQDGQILADLPLPVAGLMSPHGFGYVKDRLIPLRAATRSIGCELEDPVLQLAFLPLPVIPHLKLTDRGLVAATGVGLEFVTS
jgi:adenine deaminase